MHFHGHSQACMSWRIFSRRKRVRLRSVIANQRFLTGSQILLHKNASHKGDEIDLAKFPPEKIRNFSIIAHVDHGKSTLADRILELTGTIPATKDNKQVLDKLQVERERGITVKAQTASIIFENKGQDYLLNLIDTPGHVDFSYEVARSLAACQGVVLLVDATQGVQAQTLANFYLAMEVEVDIIPVINKIDVKSANVDQVCEEMEKFLDVNKDGIIKVSAKTGQNVTSVLEAVVERLPSPKDHLEDCDSNGPLKALLFDSSYERFRGVNANLAVTSGTIKTGDKVTSSFMKSQGKSKASYEVREIGILRPDFCPTGVLYAGQVGYMFCNMKTTAEARIGDTFHHVDVPVEPFLPFKPVKPMVFGTMYPTDHSQYGNLKKALDKLTLNDSSVQIQPSSSTALGPGFRLGFLGLLHMDVFQQRLEQEFHASVICTTPTVPFKAILSAQSAIKKYGRSEITITNASEFPDQSIVESYLQPMVRGTIMAPAIFRDAIVKLCCNRNGVETSLAYIGQERLIMEYKLPLNEIIVDFYDKLKSVTSGYGSFDYEDAGYEETRLVKVDILINDVVVPELSSVFVDEKSVRLGRQMCEKLRESIPRQLFLIVIQAAIGKKIIAREQIAAVRKDVVAKCYGGDITRRMKLLRNQKEGKKRMRHIGRVEVPKDAFIKVLQE